MGGGPAGAKLGWPSWALPGIAGRRATDLARTRSRSSGSPPIYRVDGAMLLPAPLLLLAFLPAFNFQSCDSSTHPQQGLGSKCSLICLGPQRPRHQLGGASGPGAIGWAFALHAPEK